MRSRGARTRSRWRRAGSPIRSPATRTRGGAARMASSEGSSQRRVQPRVSKTRCAFVTCGARCEIKGSRDEQGALIYRMPGSPAYRQARADRVFCNTAEAKAAGYREAERS